MILKIQRDQSRFKEIIRGKIKKDLRKYITREEFIGRKGKDYISIPVPQIEIPHFKYDFKKIGGVGQGEGKKGTPIALDPFPGGGSSGAGDQPGEHILEVDISLEELAKIMGEELELPAIKPRGKSKTETKKEKYTGIHKSGPESLRHFKRTYKEALKRQIIFQTYDPERPVIIPIKEDKRYRSWKIVRFPENNAVIIYMLDVSGSMGDEQKEIVRIESFWIDTWLNSQYKHLENVYIIHDVEAKEVDRETFYHTRESGGTKISSAYYRANELIKQRYNPQDWNIYIFHFSDGDNWEGNDTVKALNIISEELIPRVNLICYGQITNAYRSGEFKNSLDEHFKEQDKLITSEITDREDIYNSIREFLGKGK